ncbi:MAG TPA: aspartate-semialdehyde dehydrogenase, partial [Bacteroidales bacterium]|nr:aspartate-semialdehyde dehydrogenase [Bacteroidales bacterium]
TNANEVREILRTAAGVVVVDSPNEYHYPMPLTANERDEVFVGRIRNDLSLPGAVNMWVVADNLRKGAATNAVQIAEYLISNKLI